MKTAKTASTVMIVLACVIFDVALHRLSAWLFDFDYFNSGLPQSVLVRNGTFPSPPRSASASCSDFWR